MSRFYWVGSKQAKTAAAVLDFIDRHICETGGVSPTFEEIANGVGLAGKSTVAGYLADLERAGHIRRIQGQQRRLYTCIEVVAPRYRRPDVGALYAALGSTPIGKIGDGRKVAA